MKSAKRAGAVASERLVINSVLADGKLGGIAEVNSQTDFAACNAEFIASSDKVVETELQARLGAELRSDVGPCC